MIVAVDAAGGDYFPKNPVEGALQSIQENSDLTVLLVGPEDRIKEELENHDYDEKRVLIHHAPQIIGMEESPAHAVKTKQQSSIVVGLGLQKAGKCDAFVSAGNTGALLAASMFILGKLEGVLRPTIASYYPTLKGFRLLVDAGANLEIKPESAIQFAKMAQIYCEQILKIDAPKVGLLNVGEEEGKGTDVLKEIHTALKDHKNFIGNLEGKDILPGKGLVILHRGGKENPVVFAMSPSYTIIVLLILIGFIYIIIPKRKVIKKACWDGGILKLFPEMTLSASRMQLKNHAPSSG